MKNIQKRVPIHLYFDGSCPENPNGAMGYGAILINMYKKTRLELHDGEPSAKGNTNNVAEYKALLLGLYELKKYKSCDVTIKGDSQLVINQISGKWQVKVKQEKVYYLDYAFEALEVIKSLHLDNDIKFRFEWIPRDLNSDADALSNLYHIKGSLNYVDMVKNMGF